jgi:hypothetical protein
MNKEEQIKAKALELAIRSFGGQNISFIKKDGDCLEIPEALRLRAEVIENYILDNNDNVVFTGWDKAKVPAVLLP